MTPMNDDDPVTVLDIAFPETPANKLLEPLLFGLLDGEESYVHGGTFMGEPRQRDMRFDLSNLDMDVETIEGYIKGMIQLFGFEDVDFLIHEPDEDDDEEAGDAREIGFVPDGEEPQ